MTLASWYEPDSEFAETFRAYTNYFGGLATVIQRRYGTGSPIAGVRDAVHSLPLVGKIQRRALSSREAASLDIALRKSWGTLRRLDREVSDEEEYDEEANAWIPIQAYYATYHAILALAVASNQTRPRDHMAALKQAGKYVERGVLPSPWDAYCTGCPQTGNVQYHGLSLTNDDVHVLSIPDLESSEDRHAMFLRTTRERELERRFCQARLKGRRPGKSRRNLSGSEKEKMAGSVAPTTTFDLLWRIRKKANYEDADAFVLGASGDSDARDFGQSLVTVADSTVAALESLMAVYVGACVLRSALKSYLSRTASRLTPAMIHRRDLWLDCRDA